MLTLRFYVLTVPILHTHTMHNASMSSDIILSPETIVNHYYASGGAGYCHPQVITPHKLTNSIRRDRESRKDKPRR